jgi:hypothetical protein
MQKNVKINHINSIYNKEGALRNFEGLKSFRQLFFYAVNLSTVLRAFFSASST